MKLSGIFSGTFAILRQRIGLFLLIALIPVGAALAIIVVLGLAVAFALVPAVQNPSAGGVIWIGIGVLVLVLTLGSWILQVKSSGMMSVGFYEVAQGHRPTVGTLWKQTKGFLPRLAPILVVLAVMGLVIMGLYVLMIYLIIASAYNRNGAGTLGAALGTLLLVTLLGVASFYFSVKLLYYMQAAAIEELDAMASLKRSWNLTNRAFWRTAGYALLASLIVALLTRFVSLFTSVLQIPMRQQLQQPTSMEKMALTAVAYLGVALLSIAVQLAVQLITQPFLVGYVTCMFIDQVARSEMPDVPYPQAIPGAYAPAGYYPPGYPQQGAYYPSPAAYPQTGAYPAPTWAAPQPGSVPDQTWPAPQPSSSADQATGPVPPQPMPSDPDIPREGEPPAQPNPWAPPPS